MAEKILYIEDNPDSLKLVEKALAPLGLVVLGAPTGQEGLTLAREQHPRLILLDITLPDMDGLDVARQLRSEPSVSSIPILALTAHALWGDGENVLSAGCNAYMTKPISIAELQARVKSFIS